jgi:2-keto-4-pentenoate hydratase/2-oxohepta-3-ene-1,7-dioic acid hydratase in catechol pathway
MDPRTPNEDLMAERIESPPPSEALDLIAELGSKTDLAALVKRVSQNDLPRVVVSSAAVAAWTQRDPAAWTRVSQWLTAKGIAIVRI